MKKIFFSALAALSLVACVQEAVVDTPQGEAIAFENAFVDNATRAESLTATNLDAFRVYGIVNNTSGVVFNGTLVEKKDGAWKYDGVKYWIPGQEYYFAALAPVTTNWTLDTEAATTAGPGVLTFKNNGKEDLIYAEAAEKGKQSGNSAVAFTFKHLLSKVKFTFTQNMGEKYLSAKVKDVKMVVPQAAEINLASTTPSWADHTGTAELVFGTSEAPIDLFTIPTASYDYKISFTVDIYQDGVNDPILTVNKIATVKGVALEMGKAYNFAAEINPETLAFEDIVFNVSGIENWGETPKVDFTPAIPVNDPHELIAAIEAGKDVVLTGDINLDDFTTKATAEETVGLTITKDIVLDGNGYTITSSHGRAINISGANDVTIRNVTIVGTGERAINLIKNTKKVRIENVTATAANYTVNVAGSAPNAIVNIEGATLNGLCTVNVSAIGAYVTVNNSMINCNDHNTTEGESYAALSLNKEAVGGSIIATNSTINVAEGSDSAKGRNGAEDGTVTIDGSTEDVTVIYAVITYGSSPYYHAFTSLAAAVEFAKEGDPITIIRNIELTETVTVADGKTVSLDLNGKTITGTDTGTASYGLITNRGNLTIEGNGAIKLAATQNRGWNAYSSVISNACGNLIVNGNVLIEHCGGTDMAYGLDNLSGSESVYATINGGTIKSTYRAIRQFLNSDSKTNELTVNGGVIEGANKSIWMQDPNKKSNLGKLTVGEKAQLNGDVYLYVTAGSEAWPVEVSIAESALEGESTVMTGNVPAGYTVENVDGTWKVLQFTKVSTADELVAALENKEDVVFMNNIKIDPANMSNAYGTTGINVKYGQTIDGNGYTLDIKGAGGTWDSGINTTGGLIKNLTVTGSFRGIFINHTSDYSEKVVLENVTITGTCYTISCDQGLYQGLEAINSTFNGWTSYAKTLGDVKFTNCTFGQGTYYKDVTGRVLKPYVNTTLTNCSFVEHMNLDLTGMTEEYKATITNCTVGGQSVTAEVMTIPSSNAEYDTELFTVDLPSWATSVNDCIIFN